MVKDDDGRCRGIVAQDLKSMEIHDFRADAVILATGGIGNIYRKSTNSTINTGSAHSIAYQQGVRYANGEFIQIHPTAIPGDDKLRLMSESARGEGGRLWVYKDGKPWYFLEEKYPAYGNLVPRDIATREIFHVCVDLKLGINGENMVYLDMSHIDANKLEKKVGGILDIYEKFVGDDPRKIPMKVFPAVHYSMGGLWVDYDQMTNIPAYSPVENANINTTVLTDWGQIPWFRPFMAVWLLDLRLWNMSKAWISVWKTCQIRFSAGLRPNRKPQPRTYIR